MTAYYPTVIIAAGAVIGWLAADNHHLRKTIKRLKSTTNPDSTR